MADSKMRDVSGNLKNDSEQIEITVWRARVLRNVLIGPPEDLAIPGPSWEKHTERDANEIKAASLQIITYQTEV